MSFTYKFRILGDVCFEEKEDEISFPAVCFVSSSSVIFLLLELLLGGMTFFHFFLFFFFFFFFFQ